MSDHYLIYSVLVWIALISAASAFPQFFFFFFFFQPQWLTSSSVNSALVYCSQTPQTPLFINFFIKNGSYSTIHILKNYFAMVFSIFSFQFQQNKFYPNRRNVPFPKEIISKLGDPYMKVSHMFISPCYFSILHSSTSYQIYIYIYIYEFC